MKTLFTVLLLTFCTITAQSQMVFKPQLGFTHNSLNADPVGFIESGRGGFVAGVTLAIGSRLYFEPGIQYLKNGLEISQANAAGLPQDEVNIHGVRIPALVGFHFIPSDNVNFINYRIFTGPSLTFITNVRNQDNNTGFGADQYKNTHLGYSVGIGLDVLIFFIEIEQEFGLGDITEGANTVKSNTFQAKVGINVPLVYY